MTVPDKFKLHRGVLVEFWFSIKHGCTVVEYFNYNMTDKISIHFVLGRRNSDSN